MVKNPHILENFELEFEKKINHSLYEKLLIFEQMLELKNSIINDFNPLESLDEKIRFIKRLHSAKRTF